MAPTDGVMDYCSYLGEALRRKHIHLHTARLRWAEMGWPRALRWLWEKSEAWQTPWVWVQYTALQWSSRGIPVGVVPIIQLLRRRGLKVGVVFHDATGYPGERLVDWARREVQHALMRVIHHYAHVSVVPVPPRMLPWLPERPSHTVLIPVGPNIPAATWYPTLSSDHERTVAVFCVTPGPRMQQEVEDIIFATRWAARALAQRGMGLRLVVLGRGSKEAEPLLRTGLDPSIALDILGIVPANKITETLTSAQALLFVRRQISGRRASAIAGIACGLPVVGYAGPETGPPITEAGVRLVPFRDTKALADALANVLVDDQLWMRLHRLSVQAYERYFSWDVIATQFINAMGIS